MCAVILEVLQWVREMERAQDIKALLSMAVWDVFKGSEISFL